MIIRVEREGHDILLAHSATGGVSISRDLATSWEKIDDPMEFALRGEVDILEAYQTLCNTPLENELLGYQQTHTQKATDTPDDGGDWDSLKGNSWLGCF